RLERLIGSRARSCRILHKLNKISGGVLSETRYKGRSERIIRTIMIMKTISKSISAPLLLISLLLIGTPTTWAVKAPTRSSDLFNLTNIWSVHLTFTPEQWEAMEPKSGGGFFGGGPGGPGGPRFGGGPGGRGGGFGPGNFLAPTLLRQADKNSDNKISEEEFHSLAEKWFAEWDKEKRGKIEPDEIRTGLNATFNASGAAPRSMPRMNLQGPEGKRNGLAAAMGIDFEYVKAKLQFEDQVFENVAVRYKGNGTFMDSRGSVKRSLKIDLSKYVKGQKLAGIAKINLHNNVTDPSSMNEPLSYRLYRDAGVPAPRSAYARVFVTVPGKFDKEFFGLYSLVEDIDKHFTEEALGNGKAAI